MPTRKSLTPKQRADMLTAQDSKCAKCGAEIDGTGKTCIGEHVLTVRNGNDQKPDYLYCLICAHVKSYGTKATTAGSDANQRAKAKRIRDRLEDKKYRKRKGPPMQSRGWDKDHRKRMNGKVERRD